MSKNNKIILFSLSALYILYHLATLSYSPIPWFDEVCFASITRSYINNGTYFQEARSISLDEQASMVYGPVYFVLQSFIIKLFGWKLFVFRLSNCLFGILNLYLIFRICRYFGFAVAIALFTIVFVAFDPAYTQFLHSGRMDFIALFFFFTSFLLFVSTENKGDGKNILKAAAIGVLLSLALLTNPRVMFAFSVYAAYSIYELITAGKKGILAVFIKYLIILAVCSGIYYLWIYFKFGSLQHFIFKNYSGNQVMQTHVGFSLSEMYLNSKLLMYGFGFLCALLLVFTGRAMKNIKLLLFTVPAILLFILIVGGSLGGRYYAMVAPFVAILIVGATVHLTSSKLLAAPVRIAAAAFIVFFVFKGIYVFGTLQQRDPVYNEKMISKYLTKNTKIAGDFAFYYIAIHNNCSFQSTSWNGQLDTVLNHFRNNKYDYFIFNKNNANREMVVNAALKGRYELIATYENESEYNFISRLIKKMRFSITEDYSCYIYKYTGEADTKDVPAQQ